VVGEGGGGGGHGRGHHCAHPPPPAWTALPSPAPALPAYALPTTSTARRVEAEAALARWGGGRGGRGGSRPRGVAKPRHGRAGRAAAAMPPQHSTTPPSDSRGHRAGRVAGDETPPPSGVNAFWAWRRHRVERERDAEEDGRGE
jgi:hypothetical protein